MSGKKTAVITIRVTDDEKKDLELLATSKITDVSTMIREVSKMLVRAAREQGDRLIWPPQFNYYPAESVSVQERFLIAAEDADTTYADNLKKHVG